VSEWQAESRTDTNTTGIKILDITGKRRLRTRDYNKNAGKEFFAHTGA
jgi:hypothetical protein